MSWLSDIMLQALQFFYQLTGNYGLAIIFLTITINMALYPLTLSSIVQMAAIQKIQPRIQELQTKYKDDPKEMQKEMMELYKNEKVNPFGGCLPMLMKIPFFIALFFALQSQNFIALVSAKGASAGFLWINNIAKPDPLYVLVALIALTTYWSQKTMPGASSQQMAGMTYIMPFFIAFISITFPSGVQIYWIISNLVAIAQQWYISRAVLAKGKNVSRETF